jgi:non-ribosomal peptide synthetase component F
VALGAYAHEHVSLDRLVETLKVERNLQYSPLYQVNFTLQNTPDPSSSLRGLTVSAVPMNVVTAQLDLILNFAEIDQALVGAFEYNTDLYDTATIQRLIRDFTTILSTVADRPDLRLSELKATLAEQNRRDRLAQAEELKEGARRKLAGRLKPVAARVLSANDAQRTADHETAGVA